MTINNFLHISLLTLLLLAQGCINDKEESPDQTTLVKIGEVAPDFEVTMSNGDEVCLSELQGKKVLLTLWDPECPTCRKEMGVVQEKILDRVQADDFVYLPIARGCDLNKVKDFLTSNNLLFPAGADPDRRIYSLYATLYVPRSFVIDQHGVVRHSAVEYELSHLDEIVKIINALK